MTRKLTILAAVLLLCGGVASAQTPDEVIQYQPVSCVVPDELPVFQLDVSQPGDLRAYFRPVNTVDWCWVQGNNLGPLSTVVMPKFRPGQEIEYFFVLLEKKRVIGKSPVVYRVKAVDHCDTLVARHALSFAVDCSHEVSGGANSFLAGNSLKTSDQRPPNISPDSPVVKQ